MKCSVDLDAQPHISSDPDEAQRGDSPPDGTLDCHSPNHTSTDYITWNGTRSMVHKRSLKVSFKWSVSLSPLQGQGQKGTVMYKWGPKTPDVTLLSFPLVYVEHLNGSTGCRAAATVTVEGVFTLTLTSIKGSICLQ